MNELAMVVGYCALGLMALAFVWSTCEIRCSDGVLMLILFGFGPVVMDGGREDVARAIRNMHVIGYHLLIVGRFAIGWSSPRWFNRHILGRKGAKEGEAK